MGWGTFLAIAALAVAADGEVLAPKALPGSVPWGGAGVHRILAAHPALFPGLAASLGGELAVANSLLSPGDTTQLQAQSLHVMWSPLVGLELGLSASTLNVVDDKFPNGGAQSLGSPTLNVKYGVQLGAGLAVGGLVRLGVPIASGGTGLAFNGVAVTGMGLVSFTPLDFLELSLNAGYVYDRSAQAISGPVNRAQLLAIGAVGTSRFTGGLAISSLVDLLDVLSLAPFAELALDAAPGVNFKFNPVRATLGTKLFLLKTRAFELGAGVDLRIAGAPDAASPYPGLPPWLAFAQVTVHAFDVPDASPAEPAPVAAACPSGPLPCQDGNGCPAGLACDANQCVRVVERQAVNPTPAAAPAAPATFTLTGKLVDAEGKPIPEASVRISGYEGVRFAADPNTGAFKTPPLPVGAGVLQITASAPGYTEQQQVVQRGSTDGVVAIRFNLQDSGVVQTGVVKGTVRDGRTGQALPMARVLIPTLGPKPIKVSEDSGFNLQVKPGRYQLLVFAPKHITQRKKLTVRAGDVLIVDIDLEPVGGGKRPR